jgi:hypothetical protein
MGVRVHSPRFTKIASFKKVQLNNGATASIHAFLNDKARNTFGSAGLSLSIFIKQLRISQTDSALKEMNTRQLFNRLTFEAEAYLLLGDKYYPAFRVDTTATSLTADNTTFTVLGDVLEAFAIKASSIDTGKILKRSSYTTGDIEKRYLQRFNKPILKATELKAGVYETGEEFISNRPSIRDYEFRQDSKATVLYTKSDGKDWLPTRTAFGFCNGSSIWINVDGVFYPLIRRGNTFEFVADVNQFKSRNGGSVYFFRGSAAASVGLTALSLATANQDKYHFGKYVYQLNMESGEFY